MRRWLVILSLLGSLALVGAGPASAAVSYDNGSWFIGRGDVIGNVGKKALVEHPAVAWNAEGQFTGTCVFEDGMTSTAIGTYSEWIMYHAQPRYAPGNGTITGYTAGPADIVAGEDQFHFDCGAAATGHTSMRLVDLTVVSQSESLTFEGVTIPAPDVFVLA